MIRSGVPVEVSSLILTRQVSIRPEHESAIRAVGTERVTVNADHIGFYLRMVNKNSTRPMSLRDPSAAAYLGSPELGVCRVATSCEFRFPLKAAANALVATTAEGDGVMAQILDSIIGVV